MTPAKLIEIAEERNRNTGMRWAAAARATRITSISGSTRSRLSVRSDCASAAAPSAATKSTNIFTSCFRSIATPLVHWVPGRAGPRLRTCGLPGHRLPGHAFPGHALPAEAFPHDVLPGDRVPPHVLPGHAFPGHAGRVDAEVVGEITPREGLPDD